MKCATFVVSLVVWLLIGHSSARAQIPAGHEKVVLTGMVIDGKTVGSVRAPSSLTPDGTTILSIGDHFLRAAPSSYETIVKITSSSPVGGTITSLEDSYADEYRAIGSGQLLVYGEHTIPPASGVGGLYSYSSTGGFALAADATAAPGGGIYKDIWLGNYNDPPAASPGGQIAFIANSNGSGSPGRALYKATPNGGNYVVQRVVALGQTAPDGSPFTLLARDFEGGLAINDAGHVLFMGGTNVGGGGQVFWYDGSTIHQVSGTIYCEWAVMNQNDEIYFGTSSKMFRYTPVEGMTTVIDVLSATPAGGEFNTIGKPSINNAGEVAFVASILGTTSSKGLFLRGRDGALRTVAVTGTLVGGGIITDFNQSGARPAINDNGIVYFRATTGGGRQLFKGDGFTVVPIIAVGDSLETLSITDLEIGDQESNMSGQGPVNNGGQLAYMAKFGFSTPVGIFRHTPTRLETWRQTNFRRLGSTGLASDTESASGDGVPNLIKFATGLDPMVSGTMPGIIDAGGPTLTFDYHKDLAAMADGITFQVEWNDVLGASGWQSTGVSETSEPEGNRLAVRASVPRPASGPRFIRLRVTAP